MQLSKELEVRRGCNGIYERKRVLPEEDAENHER
jgi:hypothetical protein